MLYKYFNKFLIWIGIISKKEDDFIPEYHIPTSQLENFYKRTIYADIHFNKNERLQIEKAVMDYNLFCNGLFNIKIQFDYQSGFNPSNKYDIFLIKSTSKDKIISNFDLKNNCKIVGLCVFNKNRRYTIYIVKDRLHNDHNLKTTILHEIGHCLGLNHSESPSIMQKYNSQNPTTMTYIDAVQLAKLYGYNPDDFVYSFTP